MLEITPVMIEEFLTGRSAAEESERVAEFLSRNPGILKEYLIHSWEEAEMTAQLAPAIPQRTQMLHEIKNNTGLLHRYKIRSLVTLTAVAASVILIVGLFALLQPGNPGKSVISSIKSPVSIPAKPSSTWIRLENTTDTMKETMLADGSKVIMHPGAGIRYNDSFNVSKRQIFLDGEAVFYVAKNPAKPFTVSTDYFSTTALGTVFRVIENEDSCQVKLYEGKVVIHSTKHSPVYLLPGQQMVYNFLKKKMQLSDFAGNSKTKHRPLVKTVKSKLVFDNTALSEVFEKLSAHFGERIEFDREHINDRYFSGTVLAHDSLTVILNVIAQMNSLSVIKGDNGYLIKKSY